MPELLNLVVCDLLEAEYREVLRTLDATEVRLCPFPSRCGRPRPDAGFPAGLAERGEVVVLAGPCAPAGCHGAASAVPQTGCCVELLIGPERYHGATAAGDHLLVPAMLRRWRQTLDEDGFDQEAARDFYRGSIRRLLLLDTGTCPEAERYLAEYAAYLDLPAAREVVGLEHLRRRLRALIEDGRAGGAGPTSAAPTSAAADSEGPARQLADFAMVADLSTALTTTFDPEAVVELSLDLFCSLCAPRRVSLLGGSGELKGQLRTRPAGKLGEAALREMEALEGSHGLGPAGDGFLVRIPATGELQAVLRVDGLALPEKRRQYLNLALLAAPVISLALSNAQRFQELRAAERRSGGRPGSSRTRWTPSSASTTNTRSGRSTQRRSACSACRPPSSRAGPCARCSRRGAETAWSWPSARAPPARPTTAPAPQGAQPRPAGSCPSTACAGTGARGQWRPASPGRPRAKTAPGPW